ncbi:hypothetical protein M9Y10_003487 [Tritrichomonas musculus]|uniref:Peptidase S9 prolyl oligopeptidase catalytic domain-containing protein n=1 Tax=Tritrichomonas musculus TaxID=1915356 RepID=A0ABR2JPY8_9EUKA
MSKYVQMGFEAICRPPRANYDDDEVPNFIFIANYGEVARVPVTFPNSRGCNIVGSYYPPNGEIAEKSCIIYLHGNASCQLEGTFLVPIYCPAGVSVLCFDFSGCGKSEGEYISLGYYEKDDVLCAISFLRARFGVGKIALWGRSMGAATTFFVTDEEPTIACAIADSPFCSLSQLIIDLGLKYKVPGCLTSTGIKIVSSTVKSRAKFDIANVEPIKHATRSFAPIFIIHGQNDSFIPYHHSELLLQAYAGEEKQLTVVPGADHNTARPADVIVNAVMFIARILDAPVVIDDVSNVMDSSYRHYENAEDMLRHMGDIE